MLAVKPEGKRPILRASSTWSVHYKWFIRKHNTVKWIKLVQDNIHFKVFVNVMPNLPVL